MTLAKSWKQSTVSLAQAKKKITWIMVHENIVSILKDAVHNFEQIWVPQATYMHFSLVRLVYFLLLVLENTLFPLARTTSLYLTLFLLLFVSSSISFILRLTTKEFDNLSSYMFCILILG